MRALGRVIDSLAERVARVVVGALRRRGLLHSPSRSLVGVCECRECGRARAKFAARAADSELDEVIRRARFEARIAANRDFARARGVPRQGVLRARLAARATHEDT